VSQVAVTVVMVLASSGTPHYAVYRIFESLLGAVVGVAVNALILPAGSLAQAESAVLDAADMLATSLLNLSRGAQAAPGEIEQKIRSSLSHVADAQATVRLTPFAQTRRARLKLLTAAMGRLEQVGRQVRSIANELAERPGAPSHGLAEALQDAAACLSAFRAEIATPSDELYAQMRTAIARSHASQMRCLASLKEAASLTEMRDLGVILANLDHLLKELRVDLREYGDRPAADQSAA
jgi:uncharacterized membrane protein YccC